MDKPEEARQQLLQKIVERVFVHDGEVLAVVVHGDFGVVLGEDEQATAAIAAALDIKNAATSGLSFTRSRDGSDGGCPLTGYVIWGKQKEYRSLVETVFSYKKAA